MINDDGWKFNQVVCIAKGGMRVGDIFARLFDLPLAILSVESYRGDGNKKDERGSVIFSRDLAKTTPNIGSKVLLVDDLADSGITLKKSIVYTNNYPLGIYFVNYKKNNKKYLLKYENSLKINIKKEKMGINRWIKLELNF